MRAIAFGPVADIFQGDIGATQYDNNILAMTDADLALRQRGNRTGRCRLGQELDDSAGLPALVHRIRSFGFNPDNAGRRRKVLNG